MCGSLITVGVLCVSLVKCLRACLGPSDEKPVLTHVTLMQVDQRLSLASKPYSCPQINTCQSNMKTSMTRSSPLQRPPLYKNVNVVFFVGLTYPHYTSTLACARLASVCARCLFRRHASNAGGLHLLGVQC